MAFEEIDFVGKATMAIDAVPYMGVRLRPRKVAGRHATSGRPGYIELNIGRGLAAKLHLSGDKSALRLMFGTGDDAGKIGLTVDKDSGRFPVKRNKRDVWTATINAATAEGLFALEFPPFCVEPELVSLPGKPTFAVIRVTEAMLAVDE